MADIIFVAKVDGSQLEPELQKIGKKIKPIEIPIETKNKLDDLGLDAIAVELDADVRKFINKTRRQLNAPENQLSTNVDLKLNAKEIKQAEKDLANLKAQSNIDINVQNVNLRNAQDKLNSLYQQRQILFQAAVVNSAQVEQEIDNLARDRRVKVYIDPVSSFPQAAVRVGTQDNGIFAQISRNPKLKFTQEIFPGIGAKAGISANQGFTSGLIVDAPKVVEAIAEAVTSIKESLEKQTQEFIASGGIGKDGSSGQTIKVLYERVTFAPIQDTLQGFFNSIGASLAEKFSNILRFSLSSITKSPLFNLLPGYVKTPIKAVDSFLQASDSLDSSNQDLNQQNVAKQYVQQQIQSTQIDNQIGSLLEGTFSSLGNNLGQLVGERLNFISEGLLTSFIQSDIFSQIPEKFQGFFKAAEVINKEVNRKEKAQTNLTEAQSKLASAQADLIQKQSETPELFRAQTEEQSNIISETATNVANGVSSGIGSGLGERFLQQIDKLINPQKNPFAKLVSNFVGIGNQLLQPVFNAISGVQQGIYFALAQEFFNGFKNSLEKQSGLKVEAIGEVAGNRTFTQVTALAQDLGIAKSKEDFTQYLNDVYQFFVDTQEETDLFAASVARYKNKFKESAEQIKADFENINLDDIDVPSVKEGVQGVTFLAPGFAGLGGKGANLLAPGLQKLLPNRAIIPIQNPNTDVPTMASESLPKWLLQALSSTARQNVRGYNPDALKLAKEVYAYTLKNPDKDVSLVGYSAGGHIVTEASEILKLLGIQIKTATIATPFLNQNVSPDRANTIAFSGTSDPVTNIAQTVLPNVKIPYQNVANSKNFSGHHYEDYIASPEFREAISQFLEEQGSLVSEEAVNQIISELQKVETTQNFSVPDFTSPNLVSTYDAEIQKIASALDRNIQATDNFINAQELLSQEITKIEQKYQQESSQLSQDYQTTSDKYSQLETEFKEKQKRRALHLAKKDASIKRYYARKESELQELIEQERQKIAKKIETDQELIKVNIPISDSLLPKDILPTKDAVKEQSSDNREQLRKAYDRIKADVGLPKVNKLQSLDRLIDDEINKQKKILNDPTINDEARKYVQTYGLRSLENFKQQVQTALTNAIRSAKVLNDQIQTNPRQTNTNTLDKLQAQLEALITQRNLYTQSRNASQTAFGLDDEELTGTDRLFSTDYAESKAVNNIFENFITNFNNLLNDFLSNASNLLSSLFSGNLLKNTFNQNAINSTVEDQRPQEVVNFLAQEISKITFGKNVSSNLIPKIEPLKNNGKEGGSYVLDKNKVELAQKYYDILKKDPTKLNVQETQQYANAIKALIHELRHATQSQFGFNEIAKNLDKDLLNEEIEKLTNFPLLKTSAEESQRLDPAIAFSSAKKSKTIKALEEDAYVFTDRFYNSLLEKIKNRTSNQKLLSIDPNIFDPLNDAINKIGGQINAIAQNFTEGFEQGVTSINTEVSTEEIIQGVEQIRELTQDQLNEIASYLNSLTDPENFDVGTTQVVEELQNSLNREIGNVRQKVNEAKTAPSLNEQIKKQIKDFIFPERKVPTYNEMFPSISERVGGFFGRRIANTRENLGQTKEGYDFRKQYSDFLKSINSISPTLAENTLNFSSRFVALRSPVQNLIKDFTELRGNLNFSTVLNKFQSDWDKATKNVEQGVRARGFAENSVNTDYIGAINSVISNLRPDTRVSSIFGNIGGAFKQIDFQESLADTIDNITGQLETLSTFFKFGFDLPDKPFALLENLVDRILPGMGEKAVVAAKGFLSFQSLKIAFQFLKDFSKQAILAYAELDRLKTALDFSVGSTVQGDKSLDFLRKQVDSLKIPFQSALEGYTRLKAASRGGVLENTADSLFEAVGQASTVLSLTGDQQQGVLLAFQQIISKGTVQSEELRGQLAERIPGALQLAARALSVTETELNKLMKNGLLTAEQFIPKIADQIKVEFGGSVAAASNNLISAIVNLENKFLKFQQTVGEALAPLATGGLNLISGALGGIADQGDKLVGVIKAIGGALLIKLIQNVLASLVVGVGQLSILNLAIVAITTTLGILTRILLPILLRWAAFNFLIETTTSIFGALTDKGSDVKAFADTLAERLNKIELAAKGTNKELKQLADYKPPAKNTFDNFGRSLTNLDVGGTLGSGTVLAGGGAAAAGFGAFTLAGGTAAGLAAVSAGATAAIVAGASTLIAAGVGVAINVAVNKIKNDDVSFYGYAELERDNRRIAYADEVSPRINELVNKRFDFMSSVAQLDPKTGKYKPVAKGALKEVVDLDQEISTLTAAKQVTPDTEKEKIKEIDVQLKTLTAKRKEVSAQLLEYQAQITGAILDLERELKTEQDPQIIQAKQNDLANLKKAQEQLNNLGAKQADPLLKFAKAIEQIGNAFEESDRKATQFLNTQNNLTKQKELKSLNLDQFIKYNSQIEQTRNQIIALENKLKQRKDIEQRLDTEINNPVFAPLLKAAGIDSNTSIEELKNKLTDIQDKTVNGSQQGTTLKPIIEQYIKLKEAQTQTAETQLQLTEARIQNFQNAEQLALAQIEENNKKATASQQQSTEDRIAAIKKLQKQGVLLEGAAATQVAAIQMQSTRQTFNNLKNQLADLRENKSTVSAQDFINRERDLLTQIAQTRRQLIEQDVDLTKQSLSNQLSDIEKFYTQGQQIIEGFRASGRFSSAEFNQKNLNLSEEKRNRQIAALQTRRLVTKDPNTIREIDSQIGIAEKARQDAIANFFSAEEARYGAHYDKLQSLEEAKLARGKTSQADFNKRSLQLTNERLNQEAALVSAQIARTPQSNTEQLDKLRAKENAIAKRRLEAINQYYNAEEARTTAHYEKLRSLQDKQVAEGTINQSKYNQNILKLNQQQLDEQNRQIREQINNTPAGNTEQIDRLQAKIAANAKRKLEINQQYYDAEIKQAQEYNATAQAELEVALQKGEITIAEYNQRKYASNLKANQDQLLLLKAQLAATPQGNKAERNKIQQRIVDTESNIQKGRNENLDAQQQQFNKELEKATAAVKLAETERGVFAAKVLQEFKNNVDGQLKADKIRLDSRKKAIAEEIKLENQRLAFLKNKGKQLTDPRQIQENDSAIATSQQRLADLTKETIDNEISLQDNARKEFERALDGRVLAQKVASEAITRSLEKEKLKLDAVTNSLDNQQKLLKARADLAKAQGDLANTQVQTKVDAYSRGVDLVRKRDDSNTPALVQEEARRQLSETFGDPNISEYDVILKKQEQEIALAEQKTQQLFRQFEIEKQQQIIQNSQNEAAAKRVLFESQISELKAKQALLEAQAALSKAIQSGDQQAIAQAQLGLDIARQALDMEAQKIALAQENLATQSLLGKSALKLLDAQKQNAVEQDNAAKASMRNALNMERAEAAAKDGRSSFDRIGLKYVTEDYQKRFKGGSVEAGQPYLIGEDRLTGAINPRTTELFIPSTSGRILSAYDTQRLLQPQFTKQTLLGGNKVPAEKNEIFNSDSIVGAINDLKRIVSDRAIEQHNSFVLTENEDSSDRIMSIHRKLMLNRL